MQKNILLELEYLGTNYFGFQIQSKHTAKQITIQEVLEEAIHKLFKQKIRVTASGRTDRRVHAKGQVVNFKIDTRIPLRNIKTALNTFLPPDVRVKKVKSVPLDFHARFWAKYKHYRYIIRNSNESSVFWNDVSWQVPGLLDFRAMDKASKKLIGRKDFFPFAKEAKKYKDTVRIVKSISLKKRGQLLYIDIEANGFLRNMARNIVSFLVRIGLRKISLKQANLILGQKTPYSNKPAPAKGLYLCRVYY